LTSLKQIVARLRKEEAQLAKQMKGIRDAISSLEFGGWAVPEPAVNAGGSRIRARRPSRRKRRKFSAATIAKMRAAQKARWATVRAAQLSKSK
jgi:hypothetical protein